MSDEIESCGGCGKDGVKVVSDPVGSEEGYCAGLRVGPRTGARVGARVGARLKAATEDGLRD